MIQAPFQSEIARYIWESKYRNHEQGGHVDGSIEESWQRVAQGVAGIESRNRDAWRDRFLNSLRGFDFLPGGRILAGTGVARDVTLFNCFVMGPVEDSLEGIFDALREGALTMQQGGGIGYDFSSLRPYGSAARRVGGIASGPVSFMRIWDAMCDTLVSTASRRGAMMASLRCDHPDIERFIDAKGQPGELRHFNLSVQISDPFMSAVERDEDWPLLFPAKALPGNGRGGGGIIERCWNDPQCVEPCLVMRIVKARELWERIMRANYDYAEPGVLFIDEINRMNNLRYREWISTTNPCGEIPLPAYGACNLGSLNLTRFVTAPFTESAAIDYPAVERTVTLAVRFLDNVIDLSRFPLPDQQQEARGTRRIGLGITGLADSLIMLGLHYADERAREAAAGIMARVCHTAYRSSIELAKEKGVFPLFERDAYLQSPFIRSLPDDIRQGIASHGIRNSHLTAIAPAGTISLLANNVSSGIEPVYAFNYRRRIRQASTHYKQFEMVDFAWQMWSNLHPGKPLPDCFVNSRELSAQDHLQMQSVLQPYVDSAISKTINVPSDYPYEAFKSLYTTAFKLGLKGCTTFRPNPVRGEILSDADDIDHHCLDYACEAD
ncbi:MAG: ribonucleoside-diphosphate reductase, adenosylcobalamin-dependent [gamma proteobacterium symbiont of Ctena orbiculata]|nr:adenosylcobalamin-dependent ribonucleoside-diphosphate reductase [Candidatus Thiodiazotropha taylori]PUB84909.1 MAG: adenosylcobalamin-dependent ribonucleoside-diphosphate reductase [gamma proteobacterium symbiont of Ctena orbiculata]MBT2997973.1 adenosylcobalamin-dependent ribonucleoside-diphosphate reductase [Candidatus Thiodiazotropha taylori]MBT3001760.1 adenosylcobalamin-dependent ribonucleoside-diphosphate reductase [Candidatus Thiodiazotropha taylori]MBT3028427.1 adenosylcobalamin-dep